MIEEHKQFNLPDLPPDTFFASKDFISSGNVLRTDKTLVVKDFFEFNDKEFINRKGQKLRRTFFSTVLSGSVYSAAADDFLIGVTSLSYAPSIGLPRPSLIGQGKYYIVKDEAGGAASTTITIRSAGEETIDGAATATINTNYGAKEFYSDGANWFIK